jgi:hypothetical protein
VFLKCTIGCPRAYWSFFLDLAEAQDVGDTHVSAQRSVGSTVHLSCGLWFCGNLFSMHGREQVRGTWSCEKPFTPNVQSTRLWCVAMAWCALCYVIWCKSSSVVSGRFESRGDFLHFHFCVSADILVQLLTHIFNIFLRVLKVWTNALCILHFCQEISSWLLYCS